MALLLEKVTLPQVSFQSTSVKKNTTLINRVADSIVSGVDCKKVKFLGFLKECRWNKTFVRRRIVQGTDTIIIGNNFVFESIQLCLCI